MRSIRDRRDQGFTLTELLISMAIFSILMGIVFAVLIQMMNMTRDTIATTDAIQQARLGVSQIDLQVRSGAVIRNPLNEEFTDSGVDPYYSMRILTNLDNELRCAQWRVIDMNGDGFGDLQFRTWDRNYPDFGSVTDWSVVANNLVRMDVNPSGPDDIDADDSSTWPPFWVDEQAADGTNAQFVRITLRLRDPGQREEATPISITTLVTGRNTVFGSFPDDSCNDVPTP